MPLALTFRIGEDFYVADQQFFLTSVEGPELATVVGPSGSYDLTDHRAVEIYPDCRVSLSERCTFTTARIAFDAPRSIAIATGDKIRSGTKPKDAKRPAPTSSMPASVSPTAIDQARRLGFFGDIAREVGELVRLAAPVTHAFGSRRFEDLVFNIREGQVVAVQRLSDEEFERLDQRSFQRRRQIQRARDQAK